LVRIIFWTLPHLRCLPFSKLPLFGCSRIDPSQTSQRDTEFNLEVFEVPTDQQRKSAYGTFQPVADPPIYGCYQG